MTWKIVSLTCDSWFQAGDSATVRARSDDSVLASLRLIRGEDAQVFVSKFELENGSSQNFRKVNKDPLSEIKSLALLELNLWEKHIRQVLTWLPKGPWKKGPGNSLDLEYAALAFLVVGLSEFNGRKAVTTISNFLGVPTSTGKERIRECRARGFLSEPGKGNSANSDITPECKKMLQKAGVINAKKGKP
jgi:hypothetical protein